MPGVGVEGSYYFGETSSNTNRDNNNYSNHMTITIDNNVNIDNSDNSVHNNNQKTTNGSSSQIAVQASIGIIKKHVKLS